MNSTTSFNLNFPLEANQVLERIKSLIQSTNHLENRILVIEIKTVEQEAIMLPLLEYKE
jgi:hypothetical protein